MEVFCAVLWWDNRDKQDSDFFFLGFFLFLVFSDHFKSTVRLSNILMKGVNTCDFCVAEGQCVNFESK